MKIKLLASFDDEMTATRLQQDLSASGIDCEVKVETKISTYDAMIDHGSSCFALYVDKKNYARAKGVLKQFNKTRDEENPWCPKCGSEDITRTTVHHQHGPKWLWFALPLSIAPFLFFNEYDVKEYHCKNCGHDFKRY
jgi:predicted RNA-binding Zn-ribbon protein involved in translation (DUF1610 family)